MSITAAQGIKAAIAGWKISKQFWAWRKRRKAVKAAKKVAKDLKAVRGE